MNVSNVFKTKDTIFLQVCVYFVELRIHSWKKENVLSARYKGAYNVQV